MPHHNINQRGQILSERGYYHKINLASTFHSNFLNAIHWTFLTEMSFIGSHFDKITFPTRFLFRQHTIHRCDNDVLWAICVHNLEQQHRLFQLNFHFDREKSQRSGYSAIFAVPQNSSFAIHFKCGSTYIRRLFDFVLYDNRRLNVNR